MHIGDRARNRGFTLIELIVVIVILGILAATALPKFAGLAGDARIAKLRAAKGALSASAGMVHGKWLTQGGSQVDIEGAAVAIQNGYPQASLAFAAAAGLNAADFKLEVSKDELRVMPADVASNPAVSPTCFITYAAPGAPNNFPVFNVAAAPLRCG